MIKISKLFLINSFVVSNLFFTELMERCPSKTFFGCSLRNLIKSGNVLSSERDKFLFDFRLDLQLEFLFTVPLCQSLMSSYKLNKIFSISKLLPLLFKCSLLRLQLYIRFIFLLSMNPIFFLLHVSRKILLTLKASSFKSSFRGHNSRNHYGIIICFTLVSQS